MNKKTKNQMDKQHYARLWLSLANVMDSLYSDSSLQFWDEGDNMMNMQWTIACRFCPKHILNLGECDQDEIKKYAKSLVQ